MGRVKVNTCDMVSPKATGVSRGHDGMDMPGSLSALTLAPIGAQRKGSALRSAAFFSRLVGLQMRVGKPEQRSFIGQGAHPFTAPDQIADNMIGLDRIMVFDVARHGRGQR